MPDTRCNGDERLDSVPNVAMGNAKVAIASVPGTDHEAVRCQVGQMATGGRRGDAGLAGGLGRRERQPRHQGHQDIGAGGVADQSGGNRNVGPVLHRLIDIKSSSLVNMLSLGCAKRRDRWAMDEISMYLPGIALAHSAFLLAIPSPDPNVLAVIGTSMTVGSRSGTALALAVA